MARAKRWDELTRRQRREVRGFLLGDIQSITDGSIPGESDKWEHGWVEALRAALRQLAEPGKG